MCDKRSSMEVVIDYCHTEDKAHALVCSVWFVLAEYLADFQSGINMHLMLRLYHLHTGSIVIYFLANIDVQVNTFCYLKLFYNNCHINNFKLPNNCCV